MSSYEIIATDDTPSHLLISKGISEGKARMLLKVPESRGEKQQQKLRTSGPAVIVVTGSCWLSDQYTWGRSEVRTRLQVTEEGTVSALQGPGNLNFHTAYLTSAVFPDHITQSLLQTKDSVCSVREPPSRLDPRQTRRANCERISTHTATPMCGHAPPIIDPLRVSISHSFFFFF